MNVFIGKFGWVDIGFAKISKGSTVGYIIDIVYLGQIAGNAGWYTGWDTTAPVGSAGVSFAKSSGARSSFAAEDKLEIYRQAITQQGTAWCGQPAIYTGTLVSQGRPIQGTLGLSFTKSAAYYTDLVGVPPGIATLGFRYDPDDPGGEIPDSEYNY